MQIGLRSDGKKYYLQLIFLVFCGGLMDRCGSRQESDNRPETNPFAVADEIISKIQIPQFKDTTFNIMDYGAVGDGTNDNSEAFTKAIENCHKMGGGKVLVPEGKFLTGPIHLKSNVNLHLDKGAAILFSRDKSDYLPVVHTSYEGQELMNYSPLIYAYQQKNIAITGQGTFDGQADNTNWWSWSGKDVYGYKEGAARQQDEHNLPRLWKMSDDNVPVVERIFGEGYQLRPSFFEPFECENILVRGVTFTNAPFWVLHPVKSNDITIDGVTIVSHGPNNDGCDPEYSRNVHIINCTFDTGDDCIAIKSGRNWDGRRVGIPSENIVIENCKMKDGHGGVVMGSEMSAGIRKVYVRNCDMNSPNLDRAFRIKTNTLRGGFVENVYFKNIRVGQVKEAVLKINTHYGTYANQEGEFMPTVKSVHLEDIEVEYGGKYGVLINGREESPVKDITLTNVHIKKVEEPVYVENADPVQFKNTTINSVKY
ncbi:glycoside hydrolase family 28 protein [Fulvivirga sp. 29W222]|uniref:Glycoside hydrolase family 28 protein n=1 Tax=Fulvivirga marina TaxID=2494733 RepID=A0A937G2G5_9BACT|nr:glycoside hydrolase family 28 protein [Fulvivirga marina]MBL6449263.1 glycoside hydrolase family 28 protein [Fulvivirga marina]